MNTASEDLGGGFEGTARQGRRRMLELTPGQRINRAVELYEFGTRLATAGAAAKARSEKEPRGFRRAKP